MISIPLGCLYYGVEPYLDLAETVPSDAFNNIDESRCTVFELYIQNPF